MKLKNRYIRIASALAIVGLVASQIPSRPSVSLAANNYTSDPGTGVVNTKAATGIAFGAVVVSAIYTGLAGGGANAAADAGKELAGVPGEKDIPQVIASQPQLTITSKILSNAGDTGLSRKTVASASDLGVAGVVSKAIGAKEAKEDGYTVFAPTDESLVRVLGAEKVELLQQPAQKEMAKAFVLGQTLAGRYNVNRLNATASLSKSVFALSGDSVNLKASGGKLMANTAEVLSTEYPASNGMVLITNGVVSSTN